MKLPRVAIMILHAKHDIRLTPFVPPRVDVVMERPAQRLRLPRVEACKGPLCLAELVDCGLGLEPCAAPQVFIDFLVVVVYAVVRAAPFDAVVVTLVDLARHGGGEGEEETG